MFRPRRFGHEARGSRARACSRRLRQQRAARPPDPTLERTSRAALLAWRQDRPEQAAELFRQALARAYARDEPGPIADNATGLAAAELRLGRNAAARDVAAQARADFSRRAAAIPQALTLAEAAAEWRLGNPSAALALARTITAGE